MISCSRSFRRGARWLLALICLALSGCASAPTLMYPKMKEVDLDEEDLPCERLDDEVLKTDAVRWAMRQDGLTLSGDSAMQAAVGFNAISDTGCSVLPKLGPDSLFRLACPEYADPDHGMEMNLGVGHRLLDSADQRIVGLLRLKRQHACVAQPTNQPGRSDLDVLAGLERLAADRAADRITDPAANDERTRLLDGLRPKEPVEAPTKSTTPP